jgi:riboflavin synthase
LFTGLVQAVGTLRSREARDGDLRLRIEAGMLSLDDVQTGESISVNGVCLTVVEHDSRGFSADVSNETLACTTLGSLADGAPVNLERALRAADRLGGHLVSGHVDGVGRVAAIEPDARSQRWRIAAPAALHRYFAAKGSVCVDGVSLTINGVDDEGFDVNLVPHTVAHTAFASTPVGAPVNIEVDVVARYLERMLQFTDCPP